MPYNFIYISKQDPKVKSAYDNTVKIIHEVQRNLKDVLTFRFEPVGSYARDMITYDVKSNIGFDFDFNLIIVSMHKELSAKEIRDLFRNAFNQVIHKYGYKDAEDSTRVITIKIVDTPHSSL